MSRRNVLKGVLNKLFPVCDGARHVTTEDEVEFVFVDPRTLNVVNLKFHIGRHPGSQVVSETRLCLEYRLQLSLIP